jgi:hypothetical protein
MTGNNLIEVAQYLPGSQSAGLLTPSSPLRLGCMNDLKIFSALRHSLGSDWGSGDIMEREPAERKDDSRYARVFCRARSENAGAQHRCYERQMTRVSGFAVLVALPADMDFIQTEGYTTGVISSGKGTNIHTARGIVCEFNTGRRVHIFDPLNQFHFVHVELAHSCMSNTGLSSALLRKYTWFLLCRHSVVT